MGEIRHEPSMEDILASIKRIIAEDGADAVSSARIRRAPASPSSAVPEADGGAAIEPTVGVAFIDDDRADAHDGDIEEILELTDSIDPPIGPAPVAIEATPVRPAVAPRERLVSEGTASASRSALETLSAMIVKPDGEETPEANTLEALVRELLRPMLKDWLDARLPEIVEALVQKEIARISGRAL